MFDSTLAPVVDSILKEGRTACCFSYGHTGSGKTHTIVGYGEEKGVYHHAARNIFNALDTIESSGVINEKLLLQVRFAEIYNGVVYDLLDGRKECFVREGPGSEIFIRGQTRIDANGRAKVGFLKAVNVSNETELLRVISAGAKGRAVGNSGVHSQSSRSHAVLEIEIVTEKVCELREEILEKEATLVPIGKRLTDVQMAIQGRNYGKDENGRNFYIPDVPIPPEELAEKLVLERKFQIAEDDIASAKAAEQAANIHLPACVGGTLVFVDLAGSEHAGRGFESSQQKNPKEQQEAREINKSLLALKECIRGLNRHANHVPFRNAKLTMVLRKHLCAKHSTTIMIANISPSKFHESETINTLRYAALVADA